MAVRPLGGKHRDARNTSRRTDVTVGNALMRNYVTERPPGLLTKDSGSSPTSQQPSACKVPRCHRSIAVCKSDPIQCAPAEHTRRSSITKQTREVCRCLPLLQAALQRPE